MARKPKVEMVPSPYKHLINEGPWYVMMPGWRYRLRASNGEIILWSETLTKKAHCRRQAKALAAGMTNGRGFIHELNGTVIPL